MHLSVPTPLVMYPVKKRGLYYGVEIAASHSPSNYIKIKVRVDE